MKIFLRLSMLLGCGAAGVGLAFYLAMLLDASSPASTDSSLNALRADKDQLAVAPKWTTPQRRPTERLEPIVQEPAPPRTRQIPPYPTTDSPSNEVLPVEIPHRSAFKEPPAIVPPREDSHEGDAKPPTHSLHPPTSPAEEVAPTKNQLRLTTETPVKEPPPSIQKPLTVPQFPAVKPTPPTPVVENLPKVTDAEPLHSATPPSQSPPTKPTFQFPAPLPTPRRETVDSAPTREPIVPAPLNPIPEPIEEPKPKKTAPATLTQAPDTAPPAENEPRPLPKRPATPRPSQDEEDEEPTPKPAPAPRRDFAGKSSVNRTPGKIDGSQHLDIVFPETDIREALEQLSDQAGLNILATSNVQGTVSAVLKDVDVQGALDAILKSTGYIAKREGRFIYVGTPQDFAAMDTAHDKIGIHIYRPNYVSSKELQNLLTPLLTPSVGKISVTSPSEVGIGTNANNAGGYTLATGEAVVVQDYENVLSELDQVVKELDKRPMQVAIESMMLSVSLKDQFKFGIDWQALRNQGNVRMGVGTPGQSPLGGGGQVDPITGAPLGAYAFQPGGLHFAFLDSSLGAFITALETIGDTNVIAKPRLMCLNKQRAEVLIGSQLGYVNTTLTETSTAQNVQFLEVGAQLRLRPFISGDGLIRMEIHPEISTGSVQVSGGFTLPQKDLTQVTTNIMCPDGQTVIIGGLIREDLTTNVSQLPLMGSLPVVGWLFRTKDEVVQRREIVILVTPRIVYDEENCAEGCRASNEFNRRQSVYVDQMSPVGKRYLARQYFRKAQECWAAGDEKKALRAVQLAIHFDPVSRPAIELRSDICHGIHREAPMYAHNLTFDLHPHSHPVDAPQMAPWLLDDLQSEKSPSDNAQLERPQLPQKLPHPWDPGQPGPQKTIQRRGVFDHAK